MFLINDNYISKQLQQIIIVQKQTINNSEFRGVITDFSKETPEFHPGEDYFYTHHATIHKTKQLMLKTSNMDSYSI